MSSFLLILLSYTYIFYYSILSFYLIYLTQAGGIRSSGVQLSKREGGSALRPGLRFVKLSQPLGRTSDACCPQGVTILARRSGAPRLATGKSSPRAAACLEAVAARGGEVVALLMADPPSTGDG